jgi:KAP-like P-loop domain-containing protein
MVCSDFIKGDRALGDGDVDQLGFRDVAARIARSVVDQATEDGLVIGIDGQWGSGKSSLLFLLSDELEKLPEVQRPTVLKFNPWLVGDRDALLSSLFGDLAKAIDRAQLSKGDATGVTNTKIAETAALVRQFGARLTRIGEAVEFAGEVSQFKSVTWIGKGLRALNRSLSGDQDQRSLSDLKEKLINELRELGHRFVITIDDVDRLEPKEALEILRLVRSVADFPNIIYVLCYDREIVAHSVKKAAQVKSGSAFLEKIVQLTVMVPRPEPLQLRSWLAEEIGKISKPENVGERERLKTVINYEGGRQLKTPRTVVRTLDSIRFFWPPLSKEGADISDLLWLQLIKDGSNGLYRWIEDYVSVAAAVSIGTARVEEAERQETLQLLLSTVPDGHFQDHMYRYEFADHLPGVHVNYGDDDPPFSIYQRDEESEVNEAIRQKRLKSPDHYRLYFALAGPAHALTHADFDSFWAASDSGSQETAELLLALHIEIASGNLSKADVLLERLSAVEAGLITPVRATNLLIAFTNSLDQAYRERPFDVHWVYSIWDRAKRLMPILLNLVEPDQRLVVLRTMFEDGAAISWLTHILRKETFDHGLHGDRAKPEEQWLLSGPEFDEIVGVMTERFQAMSMDEVLASTDPLSLLFAWRQIGDEAGPSALITSYIDDDASLVRVLSGLTEDINSSEAGRYSVLKRENLEPFMDYDAARHRIGELAASNEDSALVEQARSLNAAFIDREDW